MPRLTSASARSSSPAQAGCAASGASARACSRCASSATAGRFPRCRASSSRTIPSSTCACPRRPAGTDADPRSASPRYRSAASSDPCASSSAAASAASSASAARASAGNPASSSCMVAACPSRYRPGQWSASSRAASPQSCAAWAWRIASTGNPCPASQPGGQLVQRGHLTRLGAAQLQLQQVGEQLVVAEPGPRRVQRHHERVGLLQILQHPLPAAAPGQQVGQLAVDPLQHAGPQQQPPDLLALPVQHLGQQVLRHRPLAAGELRREPLRIGVPGQRQRRQPQPRRPALGPLHQQRQRRAGQLAPRPPRTAPAPRPG